MRRAPHARFPRTAVAAACGLAVWLAGCAASAPAPSRIAMHPASSLADSASTARPTEALPIDDPGRIPRGRATSRGGTDALSAAARILQPEALRQGAIAIDRPSDDRLSVRIGLSSAFNGPDPRPNATLTPFLGKLASVLQRYDDLCSTLAENRAANDPRAGAPRPYPRAAAVRRMLMERGIDAGRMAVELEAPVRSVTIPLLPGDVEEASIAMSLYRCDR